jgi:hypothetical protein
MRCPRPCNENSLRPIGQPGPLNQGLAATQAERVRPLPTERAAIRSVAETAHDQVRQPPARHHHHGC